MITKSALSQALLGLSLMVGSGIIVFALVYQPPKTPAEQTGDQIAPITTTAEPKPPLTADVETELRILNQKQKERLARVQALEEQAKQLLAEQEAARTEALNKAVAPPTTVVIQARPEAVVLAQEERERQEARKQEQIRQEALKQAQEQAQQAQATTPNPTDNTPAGSHRIEAGDSLVRLSRRYDIPIAALAAANNMNIHDALQRGHTLKIPAKHEIAALESKIKQQQQQQSIDEQLTQARKNARKQGGNGRYHVQVALAANQDKADALASRLKAAGYQVSTSPDRRGVRVIVGPERSKEAAIALKDKINSDPNAGTRSAWVLEP